MSIFSLTDTRNLNQFVAMQFGPNDAEIVSLSVVHTDSQTRTYYGVVSDTTTGTASFVPFVAVCSNLIPGTTGAGVPVTLHTDKAATTLSAGVTAALGLMPGAGQ